MPTLSEIERERIAVELFRANYRELRKLGMDVVAFVAMGIENEQPKVAYGLGVHSQITFIENHGAQAEPDLEQIANLERVLAHFAITQNAAEIAAGEPDTKHKSINYTISPQQNPN